MKFVKNSTDEPVDSKKFDFAGCDINDFSLRLSSILLQVVLYSM